MTNKINIIKNFFIILMLLVIAYWVMQFDTYYTRQAKVIGVNDTIITVQDTCNNVWQFEGNNYCIDDQVILTMDANHTDFNIYDDMIKKVKKVVDK